MDFSSRLYPKSTCTVVHSSPVNLLVLLLKAPSITEPLNDYRVLIAASDGRFLVCATTSNPDAVSEDDVWRVTLLSTFKLANPGEAATAIV